MTKEESDIMLKQFEEIGITEKRFNVMLDTLKDQLEEEDLLKKASDKTGDMVKGMFKDILPSHLDLDKMIKEAKSSVEDGHNEKSKKISEAITVFSELKFYLYS